MARSFAPQGNSIVRCAPDSTTRHFAPPSARVLKAKAQAKAAAYPPDAIFRANQASAQAQFKAGAFGPAMMAHIEEVHLRNLAHRYQHGLKHG